MKNYGKRIAEYMPWLLLTGCVEGICILFLALADVQVLQVLAGVLTLMTVLMYAGVCIYIVKKEQKKEEAFALFLKEPEEKTAEQLLLYCGKAEKERMQNLLDYLQIQRKEKENLLKKTEDYEEYIEGWSHEVKTPLSLLAFILGNHKEEFSEPVGYKLEYIQTRMQESIDQMLFYARVKGGHKDYLFEMLNLKESLGKVLEDYGPLLEEKKFHVDIQMEPEGIQIYSDRRGLEFMLGQFISNAVKYCDKEPEIRIHVEKREENRKKMWILYIEDNGCGVKACDLPYIFDKGFTGSDINVNKKPTGMGLYLAREMATDLGLKLYAVSEYREGLTMKVQIPIVDRPCVPGSDCGVLPG